MSRPVAAVLFDMDGTLVDSEKIWDVTLDELAARLGGALSAPTRQAMVGSNLVSSLRLLHDDLGITGGDLDGDGRWLLDRTKHYFDRGLPWRPGARELLDAVHAAGLPTALVTSTHRDLVEVALRSIGAHYFDVAVCGDEVEHNKPHPEAYLTAAALLGVDPSECVAIEDSPTGIAAAEAAGCAVLAVPSEVPVPAGPLRTVRESLVGVDLAYLGGLAAG
ncbi:MAG TPA: HAD family phosphatase [Mycobacteriales bacterium]|nr:HAD family phosphatase [Mycobacteriales bacterium]